MLYLLLILFCCCNVERWTCRYAFHCTLCTTFILCMWQICFHLIWFDYILDLKIIHVSGDLNTVLSSRGITRRSIIPTRPRTTSPLTSFPTWWLRGARTCSVTCCIAPCCTTGPATPTSRTFSEPARTMRSWVMYVVFRTCSRHTLQISKKIHWPKKLVKCWSHEMFHTHKKLISLKCCAQLCLHPYWWAFLLCQDNSSTWQVWHINKLIKQHDHYTGAPCAGDNKSLL